MQKLKTEYLNCSKVANCISTMTGVVDSKKLSLETIKRGNMSACVTVDLTLDKSVTLSNPDVTQFDMAVMDSIYSLNANGFTSFTPEMIVRTMSGNLDQNVTQKKVDAVKESINKLKFIRIRIDCTEESVARKQIKRGETMQLESSLLPIDEVDVKLLNQMTMKGFTLPSTPALFKYAERVKQIVNVPVKLLDTTDFISDTEEVVLIKRYLIRRISAMKNSKNNIASNKIAYARMDKNHELRGMLADLGKCADKFQNWRKKKIQIRKETTAILRSFVQDGFISSFSEYRDGSVIAGVQIKL